MGTSLRLIRRAVIAAVLVLGLSGGSLALLAPANADAAGTLSTSLGTGCSASSVSGASLKLTARANSTQDVFITRVTITVNAVTVLDTGAISTHSVNQQVSVPVATGSYAIVMTVQTDDLAPVNRTAGANVLVTPHSVSCSIHST